MELTESIKAKLYERIGNPFLATYAMSWSAINWKFWVSILVGDKSFDNRISYIEKNLTLNYLDPLLFTLFFIFIFPFLNKYIFMFTESKKLELIKIKKNNQKLIPITLEEMMTLREETSHQIERYEKIIKNLKTENAIFMDDYLKTLSVLNENQAEELEDSSNLEDNKDNEIEYLNQSDDNSKSSAEFMKPLTPSAELAVIIGKKPLPRTLVVKKLWDYIKEHELQDKTNKRNIIADENLKKVFRGKEVVSMFEMTKLISKHLK